MSYNDEIEFERVDAEDPSPPGTGSAVFRRVVLLALLGGGLVGGGAAVVLAVEQRSPTAEAPVAVAPAVAVPEEAAPPEPGAQLLDAQARVEALEAELGAKELQLTEIARAAGVPEERLLDSDVAEEVASLRANLLAARQVRDRLKRELAAALAAVEHQGEVAREAQAVAAFWRQDSRESEWDTLRADTMAEVCDRGTRRGIEKCRTAVEEWFTDARFEAFAACESQGGATPVLHTSRKGDDPPPRGEAISGTGIPRRMAWYMVFCDPKLPEAGDAESRGRQVAAID